MVKRKVGLGLVLPIRNCLYDYILLISKQKLIKAMRPAWPRFVNRPLWITFYVKSIQASRKQLNKSNFNYSYHNSFMIRHISKINYFSLHLDQLVKYL